MIEKYDFVARKTGARIINCCGAASLPYDIGKQLSMIFTEIFLFFILLCH